MLLMHLSDPAAAIAKLAAALRPGGRLCVEDYDTASIAPTDLGDPEALLWAGELHAGLESLREDGVMDCYLGRRHPELLRDAGLTAISGDGHAPLCRGRDDGARFMVMCADVLHSKGAIDAAQVERTRRLLADPSFRFVGGTLFGAWGRKPA
jgi:hypothetical protein